MLSADTGFVRDYASDPYAGYARVPQLMFDVQHRDDRQPLKEWVLGLKVGGVAKAYPFSAQAPGALIPARRGPAGGRRRPRRPGPSSR